MTVADILYFGALTHVALISTFVLLRQYLHGDLAERGARTRRYVAHRYVTHPTPQPAHRAAPSHGHHPQAA